MTTTTLSGEDVTGQLLLPGDPGYDDAIAMRLDARRTGSRDLGERTGLRSGVGDKTADHDENQGIF